MDSLEVAGKSTIADHVWLFIGSVLFGPFLLLCACLLAIGDAMFWPTIIWMLDVGIAYLLVIWLSSLTGTKAIVMAYLLGGLFIYLYLIKSKFRFPSIDCE